MTDPSIRPTIPANELAALQHLLKLTENGLMVLGIGGIEIVRDLRSFALRIERERLDAVNSRAVTRGPPEPLIPISYGTIDPLAEFSRKPEDGTP